VLLELLSIGAFSVLILGVVAARVVVKAEAEAMKQLSLDNERRKRLVVRGSGVTQETRAPDGPAGLHRGLGPLPGSGGHAAT
jgi:hypothetical protein